MILNKKIQCVFLSMCCMLLLSGCGNMQEKEEKLLSVETQETEFLEEAASAVSVEETSMTEEPISEVTLETESERPTEENGLMEVVAENGVPISSDIMIAAISPEEILKGELIIYNRFRMDGWVFEWLISDFQDEDNWLWEDGVLVVSREGTADELQIIHVEGEGGGAHRVSIENTFVYEDVNFDEVPDLLICSGHHGNQGLLTYYCFLQTEDGFVESPTFIEIPNPAIDTENKLILSQWRNSASSHSWAEFEYRDSEYIMIRELTEAVASYGEGYAPDIWVWTVNGEEIGRSDELTEEEIDNLLFNENSEWGIACDRWRTIYNNGLTVDYSIYDGIEETRG